MAPTRIHGMEVEAGPSRELALRQELSRLERCHPLTRSPKLRQLLHYLFAETIAGRGDGISQYSIAFDCYGFGSQFDPSANTLIRSTARRLRQALKELARDHGGGRILMGDKGYQLLFEIAGGAPDDRITGPGTTPSIGIMEFDVPADGSIMAGTARSLADEMVASLAGMEIVAAAGPFYRSLLEERAEHPIEFARRLGIDYLMSGTLKPGSEGTEATLFIADCRTGQQIWVSDGPAGNLDRSSDAIRNLARHMAARVAGDWGLIPSLVARHARSEPSGILDPRQAVMLARQYLTHFNFEDLGRCVESLRKAVADSEDAAAPATLAVLLNTACSVEPRWTEPMDRSEIHALAARAGRLGPEDAWTRLALAISAMLDGRRTELLEMARRADREKASPWMLVGALGTLVGAQAMDGELSRRMIRRYCRDSPHYPRLVHLTLALLAISGGDVDQAREELARYGVPWGWASPLIAAACFAREGNAEAARSDWERVLTAFPGFLERWQETIGTQWHESHLRRIFGMLESVGIATTTSV